MTTINRQEVLFEIKDITEGLPLSLSDTSILKIIERVITLVGDVSTNFAEVACKSLRQVTNRALATHVKSGQLRSRKIEDVLEESYQTDDTNVWERFKEGLDDICTDLGYEDEYLAAIGISIGVGNSVIEDTNDLKEEIQDNYECPYAIQGDDLLDLGI